MTDAAYGIDCSWKDDILRIVITGHTTVRNAGAIAQEVITLAAAQRATRLLIDARNLQGRLGITDTYFHVRDYPAEMPRTRTAVVDLAENEPYWSFHETAAANIGFALRYFVDVDAAGAWLRQ